MASFGNKQVIINMTANWLSMFVATAIGFCVTPYITSRVGIEAYGLIGLANSITEYILVLTIALNSMASRFIILDIHKQDFKSANQYFNSVFVSNVLFALLLLIPAIVFICHLNDYIQISPSLLDDARWVFGLVFFSFALSLVMGRYGIVYYAINRLELGALRTLESNFIRLAILISLFYVWGAKVQFCVLATLLASTYVIIFNVYYTRKYLPQFKLNFSYFTPSKVVVLIKSGMWNTVGKLSQVLHNGLDILLTNLFISGVMMGYVSVSKTFSSLFITFMAVVSTSFLPAFLKEYSNKGNRLQALLEKIKLSMRYLVAIFSVCFACFLVYCQDLYAIWLPEQDGVLLRNLTFLGMLPLLFSAPIYCLFEVFSVLNKLKLNAYVFLASGLLNIGSVFLALKYTNWDVYAIVGISGVYGIIRNGVYIPLYAAHCLHTSPAIFYQRIAISFLCIAGFAACALGVRFLIPVHTWGELFLSGGLSFAVCSLLCFLTQLTKREQRAIGERLISMLRG